MPITKKSFTCINHPEQRLQRNDRPTVLHPVELSDGRPLPMANRGIFLIPYVCTECGYVELYAIDKEGALLELQAMGK